jgi:CubicO group peptidase (beta-lactamase class C family)
MHWQPELMLLSAIPIPLIDCSTSLPVVKDDVLGIPHWDGSLLLLGRERCLIMFRQCARMIVWIALVALLAGCGRAEPTTTPVPPTTTLIALAPTDTPIPPTDTPIPPTDTPIPPTDTPIPPTAESSPTAPSRGLPKVVAELVTLIEDLAAQDQFSGAVLIAQEGEPIFEGAYGLADRSSEVPNRVDTKFNLGSMNKMFTATAILQLVEQGKLSIDDKIIDHLPDYANQEAANKVTIHHLLTHTSGMGNVFTDEYDRMPKDQFRTPEDWLPLFVDASLQFEPGAQFYYSNAGYVVLGLVIESITGQSYYDYVMENVYEPSGMLNTDSYERDKDVPNLAIGYTTQGYEGNELGEPISNTDRLPGRGFPAGGGYSTVEDLLKFRNALLSHQLLSPDSTDLLLTGKIELREGLLYAYGFFDRIVGDQRVVGHSGGFPGICDFMDIYLDLGYTVIVLSNTDEGCMPVLEFLREQPLE